MKEFTIKERVFVVAAILVYAVCCAYGDTKITWLADVTADRAETVTGVQSNVIANAVPYTGANRTVNIGNNDLVVSNSVFVGDDVVVDGHIEVDGRIDLIGTGRYITGASYVSGLSVLEGLWQTSDRAVSGETLYIVQRATVEESTAYTDNATNALSAKLDLAALRTFHYGSPDIVESPAEWFVFDAGTITAFNSGTIRENVVIPWAIGGVPVTAIGVYAFAYTSAESVIAPQTVTMTGEGAFVSCILLTSINLPQATSIGDSTFSGCSALTSVTVPQVTSIGEHAFSHCTELTSVRMGQNAPAEAADVFAYITPPPTVYVTDPQATGWGDTWNGAPVVRPPLYGSNVTAQAFTLGGDTITEWPAGGGETGIIAPLYESGTNVTVTSTQSVYSVSVTGAGPVGIDWSGLALDGTGRAEVTLRMNVSEWGGTNVTFAPSLMFDQTPEILVTGVWEFAASTIDGVTTRIRQTWPECVAWTHMMMAFGSAVNTVGTFTSFAGGGSTNYAYFNLPNTGLHYVRMHPVTAANWLSGTYWLMPLAFGNSVRDVTTAVATNSFDNVVNGYVIALDGVIDGSTGVALVGTHTPSPYAVYAMYRNCLCRPLNANERAAYEAGWRP